MRRRVVLFFQVACLVLALSSILVGFAHFAGYSSVSIADISSSLGKTFAINPAGATGQPPLKDGNSTLLKLAPPYVNAIMTPEDVAFPRLECPPPTGTRYEYLRAKPATDQADGARPKYFFALDLHQCAGLLPRLIGSIVETIHFLGPENCTLSIVEGRSEDGTFEILKLLRTKMEGIGAQYHFTSSDLEPIGDDRMAVLAELRNEALRPLMENRREHFNDTTVIFLDDVSICMEDILELIHQRLFQRAEMVCGMDWTYEGPEPTFYDVQIARGITGDTFLNIPVDFNNTNFAGDLFWNDPKSLARHNSHKPFQVFSCWSGAAAFTSRLLLGQMIRFRGKIGNECEQSEPQLFCKEMWHRGHGKIAVVSTVNLGYSDEAARRIKKVKGYVSRWVNKDGDDEDPSRKIEWETTPPPLINCIRPLGIKNWLPWDYELGLFL